MLLIIVASREHVCSLDDYFLVRPVLSPPAIHPSQLHPPLRNVSFSQINIVSEHNSGSDYVSITNIFAVG